MGEEREELIKKRKEKLIKFLKEKQFWVVGVLIIALILGIYIRSLPLQDHGGRPGLWDIAENTWTLGPDLDPWLFTRYAKIIIEKGHLPKIDKMRYVPLGYKTSKETRLLPYMIAGNYYIVKNFVSDATVVYAAALFPVIMFALTIISFFLFVREVFIKDKNKETLIKANLIALISTFFMIVIPVFLPRTVAGIPEKESAAFFFMFLSFYLFLKGWKAEKFKRPFIYGILAGVSTGLMGLIWGGVIYIFIVIPTSTLFYFLIGKINKEKKMMYLSWIVISFFLLVLFSDRYSLKGLATSTDTMISSLTAIVLIIDSFLWDSRVRKKIKKINSLNKIPENFLSIGVSLIFSLILVSFLLGPSLIFEKIKAIHQALFRPIIGRWAITVAENRQPYFLEWVKDFGPFLKKIPVLFWLFFIGSVVFFKKMIKNLEKENKKDSWILTSLYIFFLCGLIFSRYSNSSLFNGENLISKLFYYFSLICFVGGFIFYYYKYKEKKIFEKLDFAYILLLFLFVFSLFSARSAVRLIMVLGPVAPIFSAFLLVETTDKFKKAKEGNLKIALGLATIILIGLNLFAFVNFYNTIKIQSYNYIPSHYNQQWQKAMKWVRENTPKNAVFGHWWDYGYWIQSIGKRATMLDGSNSISYWNYLMGRYVLTGDDQQKALDVLYSHNVTHFLIDSTDIGKYGAYSSIGSDENYDRYSWFGTFLLDERQTRETKNKTLYIYVGGVALDEDLVIKKKDSNNNTKEILLPREKTGIGAVILPVNRNGSFGQPSIIAFYQGIQHKIEIRYLYIDNKLIDFKNGINATAFIFPALMQENRGIKIKPTGAALFISPRLMRGMMAQIYLLNDSLNNFPNFKLVHKEPNIIIDNLKSQGANINSDFLYFNGIQGPIKIWKIEYTGNETVKKEYLDTDYSKYISWKL